MSTQARAMCNCKRGSCPSAVTYQFASYEFCIRAFQDDRRGRR